MIREATFGDIPAMLEVGRRGHEKSALARLKFDEAGAKLVGASCIASKDKCALVAEKDGRMVGILLGQEMDFGYLKASYASDIVVYADTATAARELVEAFEQWAFEQRRVAVMLLGVSFGGREAMAMGRLYERAGFEWVGGVYAKNREEAPCLD